MATVIKLNFLVMAFVILGCAGKAHNIGNVPVVVNPSDNPDEQIAILERDLAESRSNAVGLLAPTWYRQANNSFTEAKSLREKSSSMDEIFRKLAEARVELARANEVAKISREKLADVIQSREAALVAVGEARKSGAVDLEKTRTALNEADTEFSNLAEAVEYDKFSQVDRDKNSVILSYQKVITYAANKSALDVARRTIEKAKEEGAGSYAPASLKFATETLKRAENFVQNNPGRKEESNQLGTEATFYANRALNLTREAKTIDGEKPEQTALRMENEISRLTQIAGAPDKRDIALASQVENLSQCISGLKEQADSARGYSAAARSNQGVADSAVRFKKLQGLFSPDTAEVSQTGNLVVIRLKEMKFASGEARLAEKEFPLLAKVEEGLKLYGGVKVKVEGHTDSTGPASLNAELSQQRAETVKQFLVSNKAVPEGKITAEGKGATKPLASNKTKRGRAMNRRIDIVMELPSSLAE